LKKQRGDLNCQTATADGQFFSMRRDYSDAHILLPFRKTPGAMGKFANDSSAQKLPKVF
jgi:hypothetical protein